MIFIEVKYEIGDYLYFMLENKIKHEAVNHISWNRFRDGSGSVEYGFCNYGSYIKESNLYVHKEELIKQLLEELN